MNGIATGDCNKTISLIKQNQAEFKCNLIKCFFNKARNSQRGEKKRLLYAEGWDRKSASGHKMKVNRVLQKEWVWGERDSGGLFELVPICRLSCSCVYNTINCDQMCFYCVLLLSMGMSLSVCPCGCACVCVCVLW